MREQSDVAPSRRLALANRIAAALMRSDRSEKVRTFARMLLVLAIASTIGCAQKDWIDRTLVTVDVTGVWEGTQA